MSAIESMLGVPGGTFVDQAVSGSRSFKLSPSMPRPEVGFSEFGVRETSWHLGGCSGAMCVPA